MTWVMTSKKQFYLHDDESLLDGLLRTGHDINYQCKEGYCGSCRIKRIASSHVIDYPFEPLDAATATIAFLTLIIDIVSGA